MNLLLALDLHVVDYVGTGRKQKIFFALHF